MPRLIHDIRAKFPGLAKSADRGGKSAAIKLFCIECYGGNANDARACAVSDCPLWGVVSPSWKRVRESSVAS